MITIDNIKKNFGALQVLDGISLSLKSGHSYALIGPNGSGKTTIIKSILGLVVISSGSIHVDGEDISRQWAYREKIGYMPQIGRYPDNMKIGQLFDMMMNIRKNSGPLDEELIETFRLRDLFDKRMHTLSGGTRQKVSAALAFLFNPPVLILDEPTAGLDPVSVEFLKDKILKEKNAGKLILITSHIMSDLDELTNDLIYLYDGKLLYSNPIKQLKRETGQDKLGKALSSIILQNQND